MMKKITIFVAMLALVLVLAAPAFADPGGESNGNGSCYGRNIGILSQGGATPGQKQKDGGFTASEWTELWKDFCSS